ncbi:hypothetical protein PAPYR_141 [Paratrimastix pyriformis]|uniref:Uncharacterized protein n=1 Tax=Paratrimastix pyriformis TaxID=342808 RepID=A0ABQ8UWG0_9EUKA|nr:hypothetical protein PAPYR_141 [Paratrimastix pyriformis]
MQEEPPVLLAILDPTNNEQANISRVLSALVNLLQAPPDPALLPSMAFLPPQSTSPPPQVEIPPSQVAENSLEPDPIFEDEVGFAPRGTGTLVPDPFASLPPVVRSRGTHAPPPAVRPHVRGSADESLIPLGPPSATEPPRPPSHHRPTQAARLDDLAAEALPFPVLEPHRGASGPAKSRAPRDEGPSADVRVSVGITFRSAVCLSLWSDPPSDPPRRRTAIVVATYSPPVERTHSRGTPPPPPPSESLPGPGLAPPVGGDAEDSLTLDRLLVSSPHHRGLPDRQHHRHRHRHAHPRELVCLCLPHPRLTPRPTRAIRSRPHQRRPDPAHPDTPAPGAAPAPTRASARPLATPAHAANADGDLPPTPTVAAVPHPAATTQQAAAGEPNTTAATDSETPGASGPGGGGDEGEGDPLETLQRWARAQAAALACICQSPTAPATPSPAAQPAPQAILEPQPSSDGPSLGDTDGASITPLAQAAPTELIAPNGPLISAGSLPRVEPQRPTGSLGPTEPPVATAEPTAHPAPACNEGGSSLQIIVSITADPIPPAGGVPLASQPTTAPGPAGLPPSSRHPSPSPPPSPSPSPSPLGFPARPSEEPPLPEPSPSQSPPPSAGWRMDEEAAGDGADPWAGQTIAIEASWAGLEAPDQTGSPRTGWAPTGRPPPSPLEPAGPASVPPETNGSRRPTAGRRPRRSQLEELFHVLAPDDPLRNPIAAGPKRPRTASSASPPRSGPEASCSEWAAKLEVGTAHPPPATSTPASAPTRRRKPRRPSAWDAPSQLTCSALAAAAAALAATGSAPPVPSASSASASPTASLSPPRTPARAAETTTGPNPAAPSASASASAAQAGPVSLCSPPPDLAPGPSGPAVPSTPAGPSLMGGPSREEHSLPQQPEGTRSPIPPIRLRRLRRRTQERPQSYSPPAAAPDAGVVEVPQQPAAAPQPQPAALVAAAPAAIAAPIFQDLLQSFLIPEEEEPSLPPPHPNTAAATGSSELGENQRATRPLATTVDLSSLPCLPPVPPLPPATIIPHPAPVRPPPLLPATGGGFIPVTPPAGIPQCPTVLVPTMTGTFFDPQTRQYFLLCDPGKAYLSTPPPPHLFFQSALAAPPPFVQPRPSPSMPFAAMDCFATTQPWAGAYLAPTPPPPAPQPHIQRFIFQPQYTPADVPRPGWTHSRAL